MLKPIFGAVLSEARERKHMSQEALARAVELSARQIQRLETGDQMPSWETLFLLASALDTTAPELIAPVWKQWDDAGRPRLPFE